MEIGPASLSFVRDPNGGGIVLLGNEALQLPDTIALGTDGRSVRTLDLLFSYDQAGGLALLELDGTLHTVSVLSRADSIEVALSAGTEADWVIEYLEVETGASPLDGSATDDAFPTSADSGATETTPEVLPWPKGIDARTIDAALLKIEAGDLEGAADLLGNATVSKGTLVWYQMAAMALLGRAEELKAAGEYRSSRRVASAATVMMEHGLKLAGAAAQPGGARGSVHTTWLRCERPPGRPRRRAAELHTRPRRASRSRARERVDGAVRRR